MAPDDNKNASASSLAQTNMRLINSTTLELEEFIGDQTPLYAILSHTWGEEEITFQDFQQPHRGKQKKAFRKVEKCCARAADDGLDWV
jgi:hypothetical protein